MHHLCVRIFPDLKHRIVSKKINSGGLQIADLRARPIGLNCMRPDQPNQAFELISKKIYRLPGASEHYQPGWGLEVFPEKSETPRKTETTTTTGTD